MPLLEPLRCTGCGSPDLQQVKPDTYFCSNCESVSKLVDPTRVTVELPFCAHGDPITARCQFCGSGLCAGACDMLVLRLTGGDNALWEKGPFISRGRLLRSLALAHDQQLRHVCRACLIAAVPSAAEHIASGALCENPWCLRGEEPLGACPCCGGSFCDHCVTRGMPYQWRDHGDGTVACGTGISVEYAPAGSAVRETFAVDVRVPLGPARYCLQCKYERAQRITETAGEIARRTCGAVLLQKPGTGRTPNDDLVFQVPFAKKATWRRQLAENDRARDVAKNYAAEISAAIVRSLVGCRKREQFDQRRSYKRWVDYRDRYLILDERARIPAAAVDRAL
jgi:hypothetical protein